MYCTMPSGTRYQIGSPLATRARHAVDEMVSAGTSIRLTFPSGRPSTLSRCPGRVTPTKCARLNSSSTSRQDMIRASASAPVMKNSRSAASREARRSRSVSMVYVGPGRSMSTRLTVNCGFEAVAITVIRYRSSAGDAPSLSSGCPVGTNTTSSSENACATSLAATR